MKRSGRRSAPSLCRLIASWELPILGLVAPTLLFPRGLLPLAGLLAIVGLWTLRRVATGRFTLPTPLDLPMLILLAMALQALYPSADLSLSMPRLYGIVLGIAVYYGVVNGVRGARAWWMAVGGLMAATIGTAAFGLVSTAWSGAKLPGMEAFYARIPRLVTSVEGSFGPVAGIHPNELGGALAFLLALPLAVLLWTLPGDAETRRRGDLRDPLSPRERVGVRAGAQGSAGTRGHRDGEILSPSPRLRVPASPRLLAAIGALATLLAAGPVMALTYSRGGLIAFTFAVLLLSGLRWRRMRYALAALAVSAGAVLAAAGPERAYELAFGLDRASSPVATLASRQEVWSRAIYMIQDFPFTGIGLNTFPRVLDVLYPSFLSGPDAFIHHAHSIYLQAGVDLGLAGLMAFVGLWLIVGAQAVRAYRRAAKGLERGVVAGLGAGIATYLVHGLMDSITLGAKPLVLLWAMVGLIVVANRLTVEGARGAAGAGCEARAPAAVGAASAPRARFSALGLSGRETAATLWTLYWVLAILSVAAAYLVVGLSIAGWVP